MFNSILSHFYAKMNKWNEKERKKKKNYKKKIHELFAIVENL